MGTACIGLLKSVGTTIAVKWTLELENVLSPSKEFLLAASAVAAGSLFWPRNKVDQEKNSLKLLAENQLFLQKLQYHYSKKIRVPLEQAEQGPVIASDNQHDNKCCICLENQGPEESALRCLPCCFVGIHRQCWVRTINYVCEENNYEDNSKCPVCRETIAYDLAKTYKNAAAIYFDFFYNPQRIL